MAGFSVRGPEGPVPGEDSDFRSSSRRAAIINPPQAGILAVGAATRRPVVRNGVIDVATVKTVTLSGDHRVLDGVLAARWLTAFVPRLEYPWSLLL